MATLKFRFTTFACSILIGLPFALFGQVKISSYNKPDTLIFQSGNLPLKALLWKPSGKGPFPVVLFNHGSGDFGERVFDTLAPVFLQHGYAFFAPSRRGQNLSRGIGRSIRELLDSATQAGGDAARSQLMIKLHETDQLQDQLASLNLLKTQHDIDTNRIAVAGVSFGGIQTLLAATQNAGLCAAIDFAGGAMIWEKYEVLRTWLKGMVAKVKVPVFFIQAENDFSIAPSKELSLEMERLNKPYQIKIYAAYGKDNDTAHMIGYFGSEVWSKDVFNFLEKYCGKR
jgi:carboxymethylenebutenolidase